MKIIKLKARAKINLALDVLSKRPDGYHDVKMIMQALNLCDNISVEVIKKGIELKSTKKSIPLDNKNTAYKAASILIEKFKINFGVRIFIDKNIPIAAGLAGGSADAAAVLKIMNTLFNLNLNEKELMDIGVLIGADVPYCIKGETALSEGIGEILTELPPFDNVNVVLVKPRISVSTAWVYNNLDLNCISARPDIEKIIKAISLKDPALLSENLINVLESVTIKHYPIIQEIKDKLIQLGALGSVMSGSGPTVFGVFNDYETARNAYISIKNREWDCFLTKTV